MISVKKFRAKRLELNVKQEITVYLRHAAGTLDLTVLGPVTITTTYPIPTAKKATKEAK